MGRRRQYNKEERDRIHRSVDEYRHKPPPPDPPKKLRLLACGHADWVEERFDDYWLAMEVSCAQCRSKGLTFDPERYLRQMSDGELLDYGRQARAKADACSGFWNRKLRSAREK